MGNKQTDRTQIRTKPNQTEPNRTGARPPPFCPTQLHHNKPPPQPHPICSRRGTVHSLPTQPRSKPTARGSLKTLPTSRATVSNGTQSECYAAYTGSRSYFPRKLSTYHTHRTEENQASVSPPPAAFWSAPPISGPLDSPAAAAAAALSGILVPLHHQCPGPSSVAGGEVHLQEGNPVGGLAVRELALGQGGPVEQDSRWSQGAQGEEPPASLHLRGCGRGACCGSVREMECCSFANKYISGEAPRVFALIVCACSSKNGISRCGANYTIHRL